MSRPSSFECVHGTSVPLDDDGHWMAPRDCRCAEEANRPTAIASAVSLPLLIGRPASYEGNGQRPTMPKVKAPKVIEPGVMPVPADEWRRELLACPRVKGTPVIAIALMMAHHANWQTGMECYPSQVRLAAQSGLRSSRSVRDLLGILRAEGWLAYRGPVETEDSNRGNDEYWLTLPEHDHPHDGSALPRVKD